MESLQTLYTLSEAVPRGATKAVFTLALAPDGTIRPILSFEVDETIALGIIIRHDDPAAREQLRTLLVGHELVVE